MNRFEIVDLPHLFPEWKDPEGSRLPIEYTDVMKALGLSEEEIQESLDYMNEWAE